MLVRENLSEIPKIGDAHRYPTRHGGYLRCPSHRLALTESGVMHAGIKFYNKLPEEIKNSETRLSFKSALKHFLLEGEFYSVNEFLVG